MDQGSVHHQQEMEAQGEANVFLLTQRLMPVDPAHFNAVTQILLKIYVRLKFNHPTGEFSTYCAEGNWNAALGHADPINLRYIGLYFTFLKGLYVKDRDDLTV
jgi:hypothetical protein